MFRKILEGQCLNRIRLTAPLYMLLGTVRIAYFAVSFLNEPVIPKHYLINFLNIENG